MDTQSPFFTLDEAALYSRHSTRQVQRWLEAGKLTRYGHGRRPLIKREELEAFLSPAQTQTKHEEVGDRA